MSLKIGIDVGGTFTDFFVADGDVTSTFKVPSTPADPSIGLLDGLKEVAESRSETLSELAGKIDTIVHGTTVTTNAVLTREGAKTGLVTTEGVRDALEMRRGIREQQYDNRYTNVLPLVPRYLRMPVRGRLDYKGDEIAPLDLEDVFEAVRLFAAEGVEAVAVCFMNAFANPAHERAAAKKIEEELPDVYITASSELLPTIRFYERVSTTVLNAYVGPKLSAYLDSLLARLSEIGFGGVLLVMQSNGGVMAPELAREQASFTLLSGPAAGPRAGVAYAGIHGQQSCITVDMGGTSFDAALVRDGAPLVASEGEINRYRIALPMLGIATIGAGGGSIGWIDEGGLLRMGPRSAGADPGPACYGKGGTEPTATDADLVLGYLDPDRFAGGHLRLDVEASREAIERYIAKPLNLSIEEAASGMYRVINNNMAQGVREITVKRGDDPREFPMVVAGGAGPLHAAMIASELDIPTFLVPRESSVFCAAGMLMADLQHDFVRSYVGRLDQVDWDGLEQLVEGMRDEGARRLRDEGIPEERSRFQVSFDCRYVKQYHEVSFSVPIEHVNKRCLDAIASAFHREHDRMFGYTLEKEGTPVELINVRVRAVGETEKPVRVEESAGPADASEALRGERRIYVPEEGTFARAAVYDGSRLRHGHEIPGPALVERDDTTLLVSRDYTATCDAYGSLVVRRKGGAS